MLLALNISRLSASPEWCNVKCNYLGPVVHIHKLIIFPGKD